MTYVMLRLMRAPLNPFQANRPVSNASCRKTGMI